MDDRIATIRSKIASKLGWKNLNASPTQRGCQVYLNEMPTDRILIDADRALPAFGIEGSRCDRILFLIGSEGILVVVPIELKGGGFKASKVSQQLQNGARFAEEIMPNTFDATCQPILFHAKGVHKVQRTRLNRQEIRFRRTKFSIKTAKCNQSGNLREVLNSLISKE